MPGDEKDEEEDLIETVRGAPDRDAGPGSKPGATPTPPPSADDEDEDDK